MIANLLIVLFIALMFYWWGAVQGLFSAFLHLIITIIAGARPALWEPLTLSFLVERMPAYAWGVGLLAPFILLLMAIRVAVDKVVPGNVLFPSLVNWSAGGLCGIFAGILTAGLTLIGVGFLPLPIAIAGYQPLSIDAQGQVIGEPGDGLFIAVDRRAAGFFNRLSLGTFASGTPLAVYQPELAQQSALFRMRYDPNHSVGIVPKSVSVLDWYASGLPLNELPASVNQMLGEAGVNPELQIVVVDTQFQTMPGTYDPDSALRLPPTQIRLVVQPSGSSWAPARLVAPFAASIVEPRGGQRLLFPFAKSDDFLETTYQEQVYGWVFVVRAEEVPRFILVRHLRLPLDEEHNVTRDALVAAVGDLPAQASLVAPTGSTDAATPPGPTTEVGVEYGLGERLGKVTGSIGESIGILDGLPKSISKNYAVNFRFEGDAIVEGNGDVRPWSEHPAKQLVVSRVFAHPHQVIVRLELKPDQAKSMFGKAFASAAMLSNIRLEDSMGQTWWPTGFAWLQASGVQQIRFGITPIQSARELPITKMGATDKLYLYFPVARTKPDAPNRIVRLHIASTTQDVSLDVPQ